MAHDDPFFSFCKAKFAILGCYGELQGWFLVTQRCGAFSTGATGVDVRGGYPPSRAPRKSFMLWRAAKSQGGIAIRDPECKEGFYKAKLTGATKGASDLRGLF